MVATFQWSGQFILNLASMYPQAKWIMRPHPRFDRHMVKDGILTQQELDEYYGKGKNMETLSREEMILIYLRHQIV
jgi:hypothetical protein